MIVGQETKKNKLMRDMFFDDWSNDACCGYVLFACRNIKASESLIDDLIKELNISFNSISVDEAKKHFHKRGK